MMKAARFVLAGALALAGVAFAQAPEKPKTYALVSAIGNELWYVRQVKGTGSHIPPYRRYPMKVPDGAVDAAVLRGLDRAVAQEDPDAKRVFLRVQPGALTGIAGVNRGDVISNRVLDDLRMAEDRKDWDRIILVTPRFSNPGANNMGEKLHGIGIYVQPLGSNRGAGFTESEIESDIDNATVSPVDGSKSSSYKFVAPYFYAQIWVIDAKTMQVLEKNERYDFIRLYDPDSNALDVAKMVPPELMAQQVTTFVERASSKAFREAVGEVIVNEPKIVTPAKK